MNQRGKSLTELLLTMSLLSIVAMLALPQARRGIDALYVRSAREALFGVATHARALALARGGADLIIDPVDGSVRAVDASGAVGSMTMLGEYHVSVASDRTRIVLHYDARGIGRMASRTVRLRRGNAEAGLTFSSYGRVRRW